MSNWYMLGYTSGGDPPEARHAADNDISGCAIGLADIAQAAADIWISKRPADLFAFEKSYDRRVCAAHGRSSMVACRRSATSRGNQKRNNGCRHRVCV